MAKTRHGRLVASLLVLASIAAVALTGTIAPATAFAPARARPSVVVVVLDELPLSTLLDRRGGIDAHLFPNFARLQRGSTWFRNATTVEIFTKTVLPSMLTGRYPTTSSHPQPDLFGLLSDTHALRTTFVSHPLCEGLCEGTLGSGRAAIPRQTKVFASGPRGEPFADFLELLEVPQTPALYYLHLVMPHSPWRYLPSGQRYPGTNPLPGEWDPPGPGKAWRSDRWPVEQAYQRHLLQVSFTDRLLGIVMDRLRPAGLYEESLVAVVADHGIAFRPGFHKRVPRAETLAAIASVPFFVKVPGQRHSVISDVPVEVVDLVPTVADALDLGIPPGVDGRSVLGVAPGAERDRQIRGLPIASDGRAKYADVAAKYRTFSSRNGGIDPFALGPGRSESLIGLRVDTVFVRDGDGIVSVADLGSHQATAPDAGLFPALLQGDIESSVWADDVLLAVAVNGRIASVTRTFRDGNRSRFYAMLPPTAFHAPPNEIAIYQVDSVRGKSFTRMGLREQ